jgi:hypothetical protein
VAMAMVDIMEVVIQGLIVKRKKTQIRILKVHRVLVLMAMKIPILINKERKKRNSD